MPDAFKTTRRVEFCETDAAGIAHFSAFLCYMEQAEHAFLRNLGTSVVKDIGDGWHLSWPRVHVECDYRGAARFEDELEISVQIERLGSKSVTYAFEFQKSGANIASGKVVAVCCRVKPGHDLESSVIPDELASQLRGFVRTK